ncbi:16S rRNA (guanine(966)-N(2))-methyltransferase RsmD [Alteribacter keqinensis]|uniref:16S rRNA (Guanine(966)-N(2))-methyltransferase RsmD n=1 Tax=Alteribacter keqinensis TaxID=2483800 RepID=A0A3M7TWR5_9BACI|nr:16S rRNA (guanine(966)-N(2))-methyltransferase RsmD [Alteribacter keqinensis]RNA69709.1 16S rRNA (guanine(966)-N(2))-methyltransferase RsmD [Alteribacter keqinensis]
MRVISGKNKGVSLKAVPGDSTRPTTDKVKESIFNMIGPYFEGGTVLDLYGGAGGLGIEALSRGVEKAVFVDRDFKAIQSIRANIAACGLKSRTEVYKNDARRALQALVKREKQFTFIFLDPPYAKQQIPEELSFISNNDLLEENGKIIAEHDVRVSLDDTYETLVKVREEKYGDTVISIYMHGKGEKEDE